MEQLRAWLAVNGLAQEHQETHEGVDVVPWVVDRNTGYAVRACPKCQKFYIGSMAVHPQDCGLH